GRGRVGPVRRASGGAADGGAGRGEPDDRGVGASSLAARDAGQRAGRGQAGRDRRGGGDPPAARGGAEARGGLSAARPVAAGGAGTRAPRAAGPSSAEV